MSAHKQAIFQRCSRASTWGVGGVGALLRFSGGREYRNRITSRVGQAELARLLPGNWQELGLWRFEAAEQHQVVGDGSILDVVVEDAQIQKLNSFSEEESMMIRTWMSAAPRLDCCLQV